MLHIRSLGAARLEGSGLGVSRLQSGINWSYSHTGSILVPPCGFSMGLLKHFTQSEQSKKEGRCVKEFEDIFLKSQQSAYGFPDIPDDLFILSSWKGNCLWDLIEVGGWVLWSHILPLSFRWLALSQWPQLTEKEAEGLNPAVCLEWRESRFGWIGRMLKSSTKIGSTERKHIRYVCLHSISNSSFLWFLLDFSVFR